MAIKNNSSSVLSKREKILIVVLVVLVEIFFLYKYLYTPAIEARDANKTKVETNNKIINVLEGESKRNQKLESIKNSVIKENDLYKEILPSDISQEKAIYDIQNRIVQRDVLVSSYSIEKPIYETIDEYISSISEEKLMSLGNLSDYTKDGYVITQLISLDLSGEFNNVLEFLNDIEKSKELKIVDSFSINKTNENTATVNLTYTNYGFMSFKDYENIEYIDEVKYDSHDNIFFDDNIGLTKNEGIKIEIELFQEKGFAPYYIALDDKTAEVFSIEDYKADIELQINGQNGVYNVTTQYKGNKYIAEDIIDLTNEPIIIEITSFEEDNEDYMLNINYVNNSDREIEYKIINPSDDPKVLIKEDES